MSSVSSWTWEYRISVWQACRTRLGNCNSVAPLLFPSFPFLSFLLLLSPPSLSHRSVGVEREGRGSTQGGTFSGNQKTKLCYIQIDCAKLIFAAIGILIQYITSRHWRLPNFRNCILLLLVKSCVVEPHRSPNKLHFGITSYTPSVQHNSQNILLQVFYDIQDTQVNAAFYTWH